MKCAITKNKDFSLYLYKTLNDVLVLLLLTFAASFLFESILPGIVSEHLSFLKFFFIILAFTLLASHIACKRDISYKLPKLKKEKLLITSLALLATATLLVCLRNFFPLEITIITITSLAIIFYFYKVLVHKT